MWWFKSNSSLNKLCGTNIINSLKKIKLSSFLFGNIKDTKFEKELTIQLYIDLNVKEEFILNS